MYGSATFAIEVSRSSMNVARVTVTAINHGFMARFSVGITATQRESADIHRRLDGHAGPQQVLGILIFIQPNSNGETLHNFHVVPGRVFRRKQAEERTGGARQTRDFSFVVAAKS